MDFFIVSINIKVNIVMLLVIGEFIRWMGDGDSSTLIAFLFEPAHVLAKLSLGKSLRVGGGAWCYGRWLYSQTGCDLKAGGGWRFDVV